MKYFTFEELTRSETAKARGIDNSPTPEIKANLEMLVDKVLDPLRERWGAPIIVTSGYRCPSLNKAVGGAKSSQHMKGEAADIKAKSGCRSDNIRLFKLIKSAGLPFDQLIDEKNYSWIHVSYGPRQRRQILHL
ncbi:MAG: DUF882 domain-containing protein [Muribaculaceae bacterium]|nr:DUF882 domain-containing protein [Muribaculaceae bacterium]